MLIRAHTRQCWSGHTRANADQGTNALMLIRAHTRQFWSRHTCANADQGTCANADQGTHAPMLVRAYMRQCRQCTQTPHALLPIKLPPHPAARLQLHEPDLSGCCCRAAEGHSICAPMLQFLGSSPLQSEGACVPERDYKVKRASHNTRSTCMTHIKKPVRHNKEHVTKKDGAVHHYKGTYTSQQWSTRLLVSQGPACLREHDSSSLCVYDCASGAHTHAALACFPRACLPQRA